METWAEIKARHRQERRELIETLAAERITQTQAAKRLGCSLTALNNTIHREKIHWPVIAQGQRRETV